MFSNFWSVGGEILSWISYAVSGLMALVCVAVIGRAIFMPATVRRGASCGACRHELTDTSTNRCPECGGLLTKVGVTTPAMAIRLRGGLGWALLAWTAICGAGARYAMTYVQTIAWQAQSTIMNTKMQHDQERAFQPMFRGRGFSGDPESSTPDYRIELATSVIEDKSQGLSELKSARLTLRKSGAPSRASLVINGEDQIVEVRDKANKVVLTKPAADLSEDLIKSWYAAADLDPADARIARGAKDVMTILESVTADPDSLDSLFPPRRSVEDGALTDGGGSSSSSSMPVSTPTTGSALWGDRLTYISLGAVLAVYLAGAGFITWRFRRLVR